MNVPLLKVPFDDWWCPNCSTSERTQKLQPGSSRFHTCPGLHGLTAPLLRVNVDAKVTAELRADYLGQEIQATGDDGRPYMSVMTTRADGSNDLLVNAGLAQGRFS